MLKRNYFSDLPMDESSAIEFLAKEISNIHPNMLNVFGNLIKGLEMKIIRFVLIDDFKKINFNKIISFGAIIYYSFCRDVCFNH